MKAKFLITVFMLVFASSCVFAQGGLDIYYPPTNGVYVKRLNTKPTVIYNASTTTLTVKMPAITSGKVEIYRNGVKVVDATVAAGSNFFFVLRNYGAGNYKVIVSYGNTVVYGKTMKVKQNT